jgi:hypothetical protein
MVALVENKNVSTVKMKATVCVNPTAVEEVVDRGDDKRAGKTKSNVGGVSEERLSERGSISIADISERSVPRGFGVAGVGADDEWGDAEGVGLERVGGRDEDVLVDKGLERDNRRKSRGGVDELSVGLKI